MRITEVRIKLPLPNDHRRLLAYCSVDLNGDFAVHDLKLIQGNSGVFLAMPSRRNRDHCPDCNAPNELNQRYCGMCGVPLPDWWGSDFVVDGRLKDRADVFHPLNNEARLWFQGEVMDAYLAKVGKDAPVASGG